MPMKGRGLGLSMIESGLAMTTGDVAGVAVLLLPKKAVNVGGPFRRGSATAMTRVHAMATIMTRTQEGTDTRHPTEDRTRHLRRTAPLDALLRTLTPSIILPR